MIISGKHHLITGARTLLRLQSRPSASEKKSKMYRSRRAHNGRRTLPTVCDGTTVTGRERDKAHASALVDPISGRRAARHLDARVQPRALSGRQNTIFLCVSAHLHVCAEAEHARPAGCPSRPVPRRCARTRPGPQPQASHRVGHQPDPDPRPLCLSPCHSDVAPDGIEQSRTEQRLGGGPRLATCTYVWRPGGRVTPTTACHCRPNYLKRSLFGSVPKRRLVGYEQVSGSQRR